MATFREREREKGIVVLFRLISAFLEPEEFLTAVMESAQCLVAADDGEGENIFKADSEDGVKKKGYSATVYLPHT